MARAALVAMALAAILAAGCGGGETTDSSSPSAAPAQQEDGTQSGPGGATAAEPTPHDSLPNEGSKAVAPGVPTAKGGDNSIQRFGIEAPSSDRVQAAKTLQTYLDARASREWTVACSYLSASVKASLRRLSRQAPAELKGCGPAMSALSSVAASALRIAAEINVLSMRVEGPRSYLLYRNGEGTPIAIPMAREGDEWKVAALDGSPLIL